MAEPTEKKRIMVVAAHPDDPEFGCAGTVAKWAAQGHDIRYVMITSGDKGTHDPEMTPERIADLREKEQEAAAKELGVRRVEFLHHPDGVLEANLSLRRELVLVLRKYQPDTVLTIDPWRHYQLHPDHRAAGLATIDAVISARERLIFPEQLTNGVKPCRVSEVLLFWTDSPDYWVDISDSIERRIAALRKHVSQVGGRADLEERIRQWAQKMGEPQGLAYAEAFKRLVF